MGYLVIFFYSLLITIFFTPYLINFFTRVHVVDNPGEERRVNENIIPRMGGIIIYFMAMFSVLGFYADLNSVRYFVVASLMMAGLGIVDDIIEVSWEKKILFQTIAAVFLLYFLAPLYKSVMFFGITIPYPLDYLILLLLIVGSINSINLMDGLDGLVSGFSLLVVCVTFTMGYYFGSKLLMILSISLMGSLIGFIKFNAYPARIFLGDTGSQSLGFFLISAALLASLGVNKSTLDLTFPIILLGVPIVDTLKVMVVRFIHKKNIFLPDKNHMHYLLFGMKIRHKVTVFILHGFSFLYAAAAIYYIKNSEAGGIIMFIIISIPFLFINKILDTAQRKIYPSFFRDLYTKLPEIFITLFIKILLPVFSLFLLAVFISFIPLKSNINNYVIMMSIAFIILLLMYSIINYQRNKQLSDILVFVNLILFLMFSNYSDTIHKSFGLINFISLRQLLDLIVIPSVVFFLYFRERILQKKATFLTGTDLIILVFIVLLTVSSGLLPSAPITNINSIAFHSFLLYMFYKVIVTVKVKFQIALFYLSFIIPLMVLAVLLIRR